MNNQYPSLFAAKLEWWFMFFISTFFAIYLALVLGAMTTGYLFREYIRDRVESGRKERAEQLLPVKPR